MTAAAATTYSLRRERLKWPLEHHDLTPLVAAVRANSNPGSVVLIDPKLDGLGGTACRKAGSPDGGELGVRPGAPADIYRWHGLIEWRKQFFAGGCPRVGGPVAALILAPETLALIARCGRLVYRDTRSAVVAISEH